jgi:hypothetical protein
MMWQVIYADERMDEFESNIIWRIADLLGVSSRQRIELRQLAASDRAALNPAPSDRMFEACRLGATTPST